jgi:hypothetical protein
MHRARPFVNDIHLALARASLTRRYEQTTASSYRGLGPLTTPMEPSSATQELNQAALI